MGKLKDHEFEFMINVALDTKDKEMFDDIMKRQEEGKFLDFPKQVTKAEAVPFLAKERDRLTKDLETIVNAYKNRPVNQISLESFIDDVENAVNHADERLMREMYKEEGTQPLKSMPLDFPLMPIQYTMVSHEVAMEAYEKHRFPNESLDAFVSRYFFGGDDNAF